MADIDGAKLYRPRVLVDDNEHIWNNDKILMVLCTLSVNLKL